MATAQGQFTIIDYNDAITLTGYISANQSKTQMYNPDNDTYTPDWATNNMVLTPSLYVAGTNTDKITGSEVQSVNWYAGSSTTAISTDTNYTISGTKSHILTIKKNVLAGLPGQDYRCVVVYRDPTTLLNLTYTMSISLSRVVNGSGIVDLIVTTPSGNVFKNDSIVSLTAKAELWRGSSRDTSNVAYQWYMMDANQSTDQGGGVGWRMLTETTNRYTGVATSELTLYAAAVNSYATVKCVATDTDSDSVTYNTPFTDVASFVDITDPISIIVSSTGGDVFKNGVGSTRLTAHVYQAGAEIDNGNTPTGTYTWTKYHDVNNQPVIDASWGTNGQKTGKYLDVGSEDVTVKATFMVEVEL